MKIFLLNFLNLMSCKNHSGVMLLNIFFKTFSQFFKIRVECPFTKTEYWRQIYVTQQLVTSNFATNRENVKGELCFNVIIPFPSLCVVLSLSDVSKTVFE